MCPDQFIGSGGSSSSCLSCPESDSEDDDEDQPNRKHGKQGTQQKREIKRHPHLERKSNMRHISKTLGVLNLYDIKPPSSDKKATKLKVIYEQDGSGTGSVKKEREEITSNAELCTVCRNNDISRLV